MVQEAVKPPSVVVTMISALPSATAVTVPDSSTRAMAGLLELQLTEGLLASAGVTVADSCSLRPT